MEDVQFKADRQFARMLAQRHSDSVAARIAAGGNGYQQGLDNSDEVDQLIVELSEQEKEAFRQLYVQEVDASIRAINDRTEATLAQAAELEATHNLAGMWIGITIGAVFLIYLIAK